MNRFENLQKLKDLLAPQKIVWHIVMDWDQPFRLHFHKEMWINTHVYDEFAFMESPYKKFWERCNASINWLLDSISIRDDDYYCILNDDDAYEPGFFDKLRAIEHEGHDVIIPSMMRGQHTPAGVAPERAHGTDTLVADPSNMQIGRIGVEQCIVKGRILKNCRLPLRIAGDGEMITYIAATNKVHYLPSANVYFNYLEAGRWDS